MDPQQAINVLVVDDHPMYRFGIVKLLNELPFINHCEEAENGLQATRMMASRHYDIVLLDIQMPVMDGVEAAAIIKRDFPNCKIIILTGFDSKRQIVELMEIGVHAYVLKSTDRAELTIALELVQEGNQYLTPDIHKIWYGYLIKRSKTEEMKHQVSVELTNREKEVIVLICEQYSSRQIAEKLSISKVTVSNHRHNIMAKLNLNNVVALVVYAIKVGLFSVELEKVK